MARPTEAGAGCERQPVRVPGMLKHVKAIGWFVKEYGIAQMSMNLTNIEETPLHSRIRRMHCERRASRPARNWFEIGRHGAEEMSGGCRKIFSPETECRKAPRRRAHRSCDPLEGLVELKTFDPKEKVIEFKIEASTPKKSLLKMDLRQFLQ